MNAFSPITASPARNKRQEAFEAWNQVRGRWIEIFARTEMAVTATLQCLARIDGSGEAIAISPILNQRFSQLTDLLSPMGAFGAEGKKIAAPMKALGDQIPFRNFLCHGHTSLFLDENGRWVVQLQMPSVSRGHTYMSEMLLTENAAKQRVAEFHVEAARLTNQLKQLCERTSSREQL